jgi:hypothetical protein
LVVALFVEPFVDVREKLVGFVNHDEVEWIALLQQ